MKVNNEKLNHIKAITKSFNQIATPLFKLLCKQNTHHTLKIILHSYTCERITKKLLSRLQNKEYRRSSFHMILKPRN
jgi:hypothetical protein